MTGTIWKCEQLRAGQVHERVLFNTKEEAENFLRTMQKNAPDLFWRIEPVDAKLVWN